MFTEPAFDVCLYGRYELLPKTVSTHDEDTGSVERLLYNFKALDALEVADDINEG